MIVHVNRAHYPVTVLGPGRRLGIWLQGCTIRCSGCVSRDTWEFTPDSVLRVGDLLSLCRTLTAGSVPAGFTITGGEPFCQPEALRELVDGLCAWRAESVPDADILCYSGFPLELLKREYPEILSRLDAIVPEPFRDGEPEGGIWRGSANQPLFPLSPLGVERYGSYLNKPREARMQLVADGQRLWQIGIPGRGDQQRYETLCNEQGLMLEETSWNP